MRRYLERWVVAIVVVVVAGIAVALWRIHPLAGEIWTAWWVCTLSVMAILIGGDRGEQEEE